jgi:nitronate monooxygenase
VFTRTFDIVSGLPWPAHVGARVRRNRFTDQWSEREAELRVHREEFAPAPGSVPFQEPPDPDTGEVVYGQSAAFVSGIRPAADVVHSICDEAEQILRSRAPSLLV